MENPKVSVVISVYNVEQYLEKCLQSVCDQTLKDIEIIVVNDGSTDNSMDIISEFVAKDERVISVDKCNGGVSSARNAGIDAAKGEYIIHIDGDDWIDKEYLEAVYNKAKKFDLDVVVTDFFFAYQNGDRFYQNDAFADENCIITGKEYIEEYVSHLYAPGVWNKLFARSLYYENNIRYPLNIDLGEDLATAMRLYFFAGKVGKVSVAYYNYYQRGNSLNKVKIGEKQLREIINVFDIIENVYKADWKMVGILHLYKRWFFIDMYLFNRNLNIDSLVMRKMIANLLQINKECPLMNKNYRLMLISGVLKIMPYLNTVAALRFIRNKLLQRR